MTSQLTTPKTETKVTNQKNDIDKIVEMVRKWGGDNTDAILDPSCSYYQNPKFEGLIGYRVFSNCAVVIGDPVCAKNNKGPFALEFYKDLKKKNTSLIFVSVTEEFAKWANQNFCPILVEWGEKLSLDPFKNPYDNTGTKGSLVRRKVKQAIREGTTIHEYFPLQEQDLELEQKIIEVGNKWLEGRDRPQIHISNIHMFNYKFGKRWIYALRNGNVVGTLILNKLEAYEGWLMNHLMITDEASNGTPELLVYSALKTLESENCHFVTFGSTSTTDLRKIKGLGSLSQSLARFFYRIAVRVFHLNGLKMFWGKFQPATHPSYLLFSESRLTPKQIVALMKALNVSLKN